METNLKTADKIVLFIPKRIIETNDYSFVLNIFDDVLKDPKLIRKFKNQVTIGFDGYDDDPKEVFEITSIRNYFQQLTLKFPFWLYFINLDDGHSYRILMLILCKFEKINENWKVRINHGELDKVTVHLVQQLFLFYEKHNLPEKELLAQTETILMDCLENLKGKEEQASDGKRKK